MHDLRDWRWMVAWLITAIVGVGIWVVVILAVIRLVQSGWWPWVLVALGLGGLVWLLGKERRDRR